MALDSDDGMLADRLVARFFRYLAVSSQSDPRATTVPSSPGQWDMARLLQAELLQACLSNVHLDEHAVVTAHLPGTVPSAPPIGFCAHVDTMDVGLSPDIHPSRVVFSGIDMCLNPGRDIWLRAAEHPELQPYTGQQVLVGDGTSVLGADNKAAVAIVMELVSTLTHGKTRHGDIFVAFVPDEEIGMRGAKVLDLARFPVDFAYTIDACGVGEMVVETFNAAQVTVEIEGVTAHPMSAIGVMVNPVLVATDFIRRFDPLDTPEHTEDRNGYCYVTGMTANRATAVVTVSLRDFDASGMATRKDMVRAALAATQAAHPRATLTCRIEDSYRNISDCLGNDRRCLDLLERGFGDLGIQPKIFPMRGGTDGSVLSARGVPTPNYFTGALNFHSPFECLPVPSFVLAYRLTARLCTLAAG